MKKRLWIWAAVVVAAVGLIMVSANADAPWRGGWKHRGPLQHMARELNLSGAQRAQVESIWKAEKPTVAQLVTEFAAENKEMEAVMQGNPDPHKVQAIADRQGTTLAKLLIEKEKMKSKIYSTVLKADQRSKASSMEKRWDGRIDWLAGRLSE